MKDRKTQSKKLKKNQPKSNPKLSKLSKFKTPVPKMNTQNQNSKKL
jgi:hypothetical protein